MFSWFGIAATGRTITFEGTTIPEYDVVDWAKCERAIADPYGWQRTIQSARSLPWTRVKGLYR